jgi:DNA-binding MarR family transcriptional regulator
MDGERWLNDDEARVWRAFVALSAGVKGNIDTMLKESSGIAIGDYEVLVHLSESPGRRLRMKQLSARTMHSRSQLSQRVDRMVSRGLVERERCEDDARGMWAVLTDVGMETIERAAPIHVKHVRELFIDLVDPELLPTLYDVFHVIASHSLTDDALADLR